MGEVLRIFIRPKRGALIYEMAAREIVVGTGLEGDHFKKGSRQVTLLSKEAWNEACNDLGASLDPITRRANLLVEGVDLKNSKDKVLLVGQDIQIKITGETKPCRLMDDAHPGLKDALKPDWRGGVFGEVLQGGIVRKGDLIRYAP
jgi:MOSC domain-containing protein YiiM